MKEFHWNVTIKCIFWIDFNLIEVISWTYFRIEWTSHRFIFSQKYLWRRNNPALTWCQGNNFLIWIHMQVKLRFHNDNRYFHTRFLRKIQKNYYLKSLFFFSKQVDRSTMENYGLESIFDRVLSELVTKMRELKMDKTELSCLKAIVLFNPGLFFLLTIFGLCFSLKIQKFASKSNG